MNVDVVHWRANEDMPLDKLTEAVIWVQEQTGKPTVYMVYPTYPQVKQAQGGNQKGVYTSGIWHSIVVSDVPLTEDQANEVMCEYYPEEDARGDYYRLLVGLRSSNGRTSTTPTEHDRVNH
jgi:hypothetical protein